jgi:hypothetical protein
MWLGRIIYMHDLDVIFQHREIYVYDDSKQMEST